MARDGTETRMKLAAAALELFATRGIGETTTREITTLAGVAEGTLYRHFESRDDLAWTLFRENYADYAGRIAALIDAADVALDALDSILAAFCALYDRDTHVFRFLLLSQHEFVRRITPEMPSPIREVRRLIERLIADGSCRVANPALATAFALGPLLQAASANIYGDLPGPLVQWHPDIAAATRRSLAIERGFQ